MLVLGVTAEMTGLKLVRGNEEVQIDRHAFPKAVGETLVIRRGVRRIGTIRGLKARQPNGKTRGRRVKLGIAIDREWRIDQIRETDDE